MNMVIWKPGIDTTDNRLEGFFAGRLLLLLLKLNDR